MLLLLNPSIAPGRRDLPLELYETELHMADGRAHFSFVKANFAVEVSEGPGRADVQSTPGYTCEWHMYAHTCMCIHPHKHTCVHAPIHAPSCAHAQVHTCTHALHTRRPAHPRKHACTHTYVLAHTSTRC